MANPFTLTFGKKPTEHIIRYENMDEVVTSFISEPARCQTYLIRGVRGSGKTVLMTSIAQKIVQEEEWINVDLNATQNLIDEFAYRLEDACRDFKDILDRGVEISAAGFGVGIGSQAMRDGVSLAESLMSKLMKKGKKVLITIDEVENNQEMKRFASQFQIWIRKDFPIYLLMTGLYENIDAIQNNSQLTFLLRSPKITVGPLGVMQETKHYETALQVKQEEALELAKITKGYAFAFQALGMLYWDYSNKEELEQIVERMDSLLDEYVYRKIWSDLSPQDRNIMKYIPDEGTIKTGDLCEKAGITTQVFSKYRERLVERGLIAPAGHGYVEGVLPRFSTICKYYE